MTSKPDPTKIAMIELEKRGHAVMPANRRIEFIQARPAARESNCRNCGAPPTRAGYCLYCGTETALGRFPVAPVTAESRTRGFGLLFTPTPGRRQTF